MDYQDEIYTPEEVAEYLKVTAKTIRLHLREGTLRGFKMGTNWRVRREDLREFINSNMNQAPTQDPKRGKPPG